MAENIENNGCSQIDNGEHEGYVKSSRSFNRIWKERDRAQPRLLEAILYKMCIRDSIIIAATANSGYTAFPASFSNVIGVKAKDTFNIDAEGLRDKGVDFATAKRQTMKTFA